MLFNRFLYKRSGRSSSRVSAWTKHTIWRCHRCQLTKKGLRPKLRLISEVWWKKCYWMWTRSWRVILLNQNCLCSGWEWNTQMISIKLHQVNCNYEQCSGVDGILKINIYILRTISYSGNSIFLLLLLFC